MTDSVTTRYAGTRMPRVEDTRLLTGHGTVDDIQRPGMLPDTGSASAPTVQVTEENPPGFHR